MQSPSRFVLLQTVFLVVIASSARAPLAAVAQSSGEAFPPAAVCTVQELSREPLVLGEGARVYVEADAFVADARGNTLLAGTPNSLTRMSAQGAVTAVVDDSILGVVIPRSGPARSIPIPVPAGGKLEGVRVTARANGGWAVGFAEVKPRQGSESADSTTRLWYGIYDGAEWTSLEELPMPPSGVVDARWASSLVSRGDTISWAMTHRTASGPQIVLFERRRDHWSHELIRTFHSEVELGHSDALGLMLLVVQPYSGPGERYDANSLVLWSRYPAWRAVRRLVHGSVVGRVYRPRFAPSFGGDVLTWESPSTSPRPRGLELRALLGRWQDSAAQHVALDSVVSSMQGYSNTVSLRRDLRLWVSIPVASDRSRAELRFFADSARSAVVLGAVSNPYVGFIAAAPTSADTVLVTGLRYAENRYLVSLLLRARIDCQDGPNPRR